MPIQQVPTGQLGYLPSRAPVAIDAASATDDIGWASDFSNDGAVLVVGQGFSNIVRIYDWNGTTYTQRGANLTGADYYGMSVAISGDGLVLAIGANDENGTFNDEGAVYIYDWVDPNWVQRGTALKAPTPAASERFGAYLDLSDDGEVMVVAVTGTDEVLVYDRNLLTWDVRSTFTASGQKSIGYPCAISGDALTLVLGEDLFSGNSRHQFYTWNGSSWDTGQLLTEEGDLFFDISTDFGAVPRCWLNTDGSIFVATLTTFDVIEVEAAGGVGVIYTRSGSTYSQEADVSRFCISQTGGVFNGDVGLAVAYDSNTEEYIFLTINVANDSETNYTANAEFFSKEALTEDVDITLEGPIEIVSTGGGSLQRGAYPNPDPYRGRYAFGFSPTIIFNDDRTLLLDHGIDDIHDADGNVIGFGEAVWQWDGTAWSLLQYFPTNGGGGAGCTMSRDGTRIFIGYDQEDNGGTFDAGAVWQYDFNNGTGLFEIQNGGDPIIRGTTLDEWLGQSVATNTDGTVLHVCKANAYQTVTYDHAGGAVWNLRANSLINDPAGTSDWGEGMTCSGDGTVITSPCYNSSSNLFIAQTYKWNGAAWEKRGANHIGLPADFYEVSGVCHPDDTGDVLYVVIGNGTAQYVQVWDWVDPNWVERVNSPIIPVAANFSYAYEQNAIWASADESLVIVGEYVPENPLGDIEMVFYGDVDGLPCIRKTAGGVEPVVVDTICVEEAPAPYTEQPPPNVPQPPGSNQNPNINCGVDGFYEAYTLDAPLVNDNPEYNIYLVEEYWDIDFGIGVCQE